MVQLSTIVFGGLGLLTSGAKAALTVNLDDEASIKAAAALVAEDLLTFYHGDEPGQVPGILPGPPPDGDYYWWIGGAMWGALLDYRHYTGDKDYDKLITDAILFQTGPDEDFMPPNWTASMGNDDQGFWALTAMLAAETAYTDPEPDQAQWLSLAQAVFNEQTHEDRRVPSGRCKGGLRWQVYPSNNGYKYINTIANGCYFNIGARLARYTGNDTYAELASNTWDILTNLGYVDEDWNVYDGAHLPDCTDVNKAQFSYNAALLLQGCAFMYNHTDGAAEWEERINGLLNRTLEFFFPEGIAVERACEPGNCNTDMTSYKGYMHRWLASTSQLAPFTVDRIMPVLKTSTAAAVKQCTGGDNGRFCGFHWDTGVFDNIVGAGQQMNVLGALSSLLTVKAAAPVTNTTGGTSVGNANAGSDETVVTQPVEVTTGDRAGAGFITVLFIAGAMGAFAWMSFD
ncbi:glycoside hydrolase family 76 protein [Pseudomassariella vexata]|uniref:Mannan endo-1,6-alpha-mannosidase n=1 Tax=Pseudomassariella vexata TaxID=1141098 RepID=A0A1Y2DEW8_9PEZI|nr:glycoside hydrolase family 76 protein [Pseudomassariella vexata]ORY57737.1 glycoside hydrolase family 76 protein [Pseudomassariella vexata]